MSTQLENIVEIMYYHNLTDSTLKTKYSALQDNLETMSTPDILQEVFELTFPNSNYQPMSKDFVNNKAIFSEGLNRFIQNLSMLDLLGRPARTMYDYHFKHVLHNFSLTLDDLVDFFPLHCPKDIPLHVKKIDAKRLEISYLPEHDTK